MYTAGNLIYFDPFHFKNGAAPKPKYFLVLKVVDNNVILASLPSSVVHLPRHVVIEHGCIEIPEGCINCYVFKAKTIITKNNWGFDFDTFLYGQWIDDFEIAQLTDIYPIENVDYEIIGELTESELANVIKCFATSATVKRKYKRLLSQSYAGIRRKFAANKPNNHRKG